MPFDGKEQGKSQETCYQKIKVEQKVDLNDFDSILQRI